MPGIKVTRNKPKPKKRMQFRDVPAELWDIQWLDFHGVTVALENPIGDPEDRRVFTIGWKVRETETHIRLAQSVCGVGHFAGTVDIPKLSIRHTRKLSTRIYRISLNDKQIAAGGDGGDTVRVIKEAT